MSNEQEERSLPDGKTAAHKRWETTGRRFTGETTLTGQNVNEYISCEGLERYRGGQIAQSLVP